MNPPQHHHFLIAAQGTLGDMHPFFGLARALMRRGHRVTFIGTGAHDALANRAGIPFHPLGSSEQYEAALLNPLLWHPVKGFAAAWRALKGGLHSIRQFVATLPKEEGLTVIAHPLCLPAVALARADRPDIRTIGAYLAPSNLRSLHTDQTIGPWHVPPWVPLRARRWIWKLIDATLVNSAALPSLNEERKVVGLPAVADFPSHLYSVPDLTVTLFPSWFSKSAPDWPKPHLEGCFALFDADPAAVCEGRLAEFLSTGTRPIVFTPGTAHRHAFEYFSSALQATQQLNIRALFLTPYRDQVPVDLPSNVLWEPYVPFHALLPRVAALVHHGGVGTLAEALRAGVPQLIVPMAHDQFDNAARLESFGVARSLLGSRLTTPRLIAVLKELLDSEDILEACQREKQHNFDSEQGLELLCSQLENWLDSGS